MRNIRWICVLLFGALFFDLSFAQTATTSPEEELVKKVRTAGEVAPLGSTPFGENISTYDGTLSFRQVDIDQPGLGLPIQLARTYRTDDSWRFSAFVDWKLEIPHIETLSANASGSEDDIATWFFLNDANRCSNFRQAPSIVLSSGGSPVPIFYLPGHWWNGYQLVIPGLGTQDLLLRDSSNTASPQMPSDEGGLRNFHVLTKQNWMVSCLASTSNGKPGEGFFVVSPDGVKYWMDWLTHKKYQKVGFAQPGFGGVGRRTAMMMVSRVEDRFGNSLSYSYDANGDLTSIQASDGRRLMLTYESWQGDGGIQTRIHTATLSANDAPSRTWTYTYDVASNLQQHLAGVVQPDGRAWSFNLEGLHYSWGAAPIIVYRSSDGCTYDINNTTSNRQGEIVHPSGLVGEFNLKLVMRGRSYVPFRCSTLSGGQHSLDIANAYTVAAMSQKKISGPGVSTQIWSYNYSPANQSWDKDCGSGCATTVWTEVIDPAGKAVRYTFSNRYDVSEGRLVRTDYFSGLSGSSVARTEEYVYANPAAGPWPSRVGIIRQPNVNSAQLEQLAPTSTNVVVQDGVTFAHATDEFDAFARPLRVTRSNSLGNSRADTSEYHDDLVLWVLGQVKRTTTNGIESSRTEYAWKASPTKTFAFSKLQRTIGYNTGDGTVSHILDGNNNRTVFRSWMRGIPRQIEYADGTSKYATVNELGLITSVRDEIDARTCYEYDPMGRLARVVYTSEVQPPVTESGVCDTSDWNATTQIFEPVATTEYGIPAGHWRQTVSTGNAYKITYFDALWRPLVVREYDSANVSGTQRFQRFAYDHDGRVTFASYHSTVDNPTTGSWTSYDALGRVTAASQDSELAAPNNVLTTLTQYLNGFQTRVTNPKGQVTTTSYMAYDQPAYDWPVNVSHPEGAYTDIVRDVFGKPKTLTRRNANSSLQVQRHFVYDSHQRLCKSIEPETGTTLYRYDDAGNLLRTDFGMPVFAPSPCDESTMTVMAAPPTGGNNPPQMAPYALRTYDVRNRIATLTFPDHNGDQTWTYTPDGLPQRIITLNSEGRDTVVNEYFYNRRRLLTRETLSQPGWYSWPVDYDYNRNGHLFGQLYPNGLYVDYGVNALGQPTRAGNFATGVQYYPNGAIKQFTYGNGVVHTMTQNARQLPARSTDSGGVLDLDTRFDPNGNVSDIYDVARGAHYNRHMQYDGLDRLTAAGSGVFGGDTWHRFTYDALDNMTSWKLAGVKDYASYYYDPETNRLTNILNSAGATVVGLSYDRQGNLRNKNGQGYLFDYGNRLREAEEREGYYYDGYGRRILSWRPDGGLNFFLYGQAGQLWYQEYDAKSLAVENVYLAGSLVGTREFDWNAGTFTSKYHHTDALGSPVAVTNAAGQVTERNEYEPYGAVISKPNYEGIGYTGHVQDAATGLTYMQQRYYDPQIGRFLSVDPVTAESVRGANFNRYWYGNNNPYRFSDPDGRQSIIREMFGRLFPIFQNSGQSGSSDLSGSNDGDIDADGQADGRGQGAEAPPKTESDHAVDRLKFMKPPVSGRAGDRGELAGEGGDDGAERDLEPLREVPGAKSKWTSLGKELIYLPDGRIVDKHRSSRPYKDGPPENTPTIKIYRPGGGSVPEVTIRYPER